MQHKKQNQGPVGVGGARKFTGCEILKQQPFMHDGVAYTADVYVWDSKHIYAFPHARYSENLQFVDLHYMETAWSGGR